MKTRVKPAHETTVQGTEERQRDPDEGRPRAGNDPTVVKRQKQASVAGAKEAGCSRPEPQRQQGTASHGGGCVCCSSCTGKPLKDFKKRCAIYIL